MQNSNQLKSYENGINKTSLKLQVLNILTSINKDINSS